MSIDPIEEQLRTALRREEPRPGFADRVLARIVTQEKAASRRPWFRFPRMTWALVMVLFAGAVGGFMYRRSQEERTRGEVAKQQAVIALRLAGAKIQLAESKVRRLSE